ncbi:hypothetical protein Tco_0466289 [Tanacetum coccineum]
MEADEDDNPNDTTDIFKIEGNLFNFETPLCKAFIELNYLLKVDTDLFTFDIQEIKTYEEHGYELNNNMTGDVKKPWTNNGVPYQLWDATPRVMKFCAWLKNSFENFHELDHDVLVKLEECWWKVNTHECTLFTHWENHGQGPFANAKAKKIYDPYLDIIGIFGRTYGTNNAGDTQGSQEHKKEHEGNKHTLSSKPTHDPSICQVRRFKMMKYSFNADDEYVAIKEHKYFNHSRANIDVCQAYQELFSIIYEGWLVTKAKEE